MGGGSDKPPGQYIGWWGDLGSPPQKGMTQYSISANRQKPLAGTLHAAIFNSWRRFRGQVLYVVPPFVGFYLLMDWATKRNHYLMSKAGRAETAALEAAEAAAEAAK